jgi:serpin B
VLLGFSTIDKFDRCNGENKISDGNNKMGFELFRNLNVKEEDKNLVVTPLGLYAPISLISENAEGKTKDEISKFLGFENGTLKKDFCSLKHKLEKDNGDNGEIKISNSMWINKKFKFDNEFETSAKDIFNTYLQKMDFSDQKCPDMINQKISTKTNGRINKMVNKVDKNDKLIITNSVLFKTDWKVPFNKAYTFNDDFHTKNHGLLNTEYMKYDNKLYVYEENNFKSFKIPYKLNENSMYIVIPNENISIDDFIQNFSYDMFLNSANNMKEEDVNISIPKFKVEYSKNLNQTMQELGLISCFRENAELNKISPDISVTEVLQKCVFNIDEAGAGNSLIKGDCTNKRRINDGFKVNRPFLFYIYNEENNTILFCGKIIEPCLD